MARKSTLDFAIPRRRAAHDRARARLGEREDHVYGVLARDPDFHRQQRERCALCGDFHANPAEDEIGWVTPGTPRKIARAWATGHGLDVVVQRKLAHVTRRPARRTLYTRTWIGEGDVAPSANTEWEDFEVFFPDGMRTRC